MQLILRYVLGVALLCVAGAKLGSGYAAGSILPHGLFFAIASAEVVLGVLAFTRWFRIAAQSAGVLCLGGFGLAMMFPRRPCGCLGRLLELDQRTHLMLLATLGVVVCLILVERPPVQSHRGHRASAPPK